VDEQIEHTSNFHSNLLFRHNIDMISWCFYSVSRTTQ